MSRPSRAWLRDARWALVSLLGVSTLGGCVARDAGFELSRARVKERVGLNAHWNEVDDTDIATAKRSLLARPLTADAAARLAVLQSPKTQAAFERIGVARAGLAEALALPNPELEAGFRSYPTQTKIELGASLDLSELLLVPWRKEAAAAGLDAASIETAGQILDIAMEARVALIDAQAAGESLALEREETKTGRGVVEFAEVLREAGNVPELYALERRAMEEEAALALGAAELQEASTRAQLAAALGLWGEEATSIKLAKLADVPADGPDLGAVESAAVARSLELEALRYAFEADAKRLDAARARGGIPEVRASVALEREEDDWGYGPHVGVGLPIFDHNQGAIEAAGAEGRRTRAVHDDTAIRVRASARTVAARVGAAETRARTIKATILPLRAKILEESLLQYNAMSLGAHQLLAAKRAQIAAQKSYVAALRDYWVARAELDQLLAGRMPRERGAAGAPVSVGVAPGDGH